MFESVHRLGSAIRHAPLLSRQEWLWRAVEPVWESAFRRTSANGFETRVNGDVFRLEYRYGARYDRDDHQAYEPVISGALAAAIAPGMTVWDLGAHIGLLTLAAARHVGPQGRVVSFEPAPATFSTLRHHVTLNGFDDRVEVVNAVVSDRSGSTSFYVYGDSMSASLGRDNLDVLSPQKLTDPSFEAREIEVRTVTADQFAAQRNSYPDVVKIDVEGAELLVLRGARELLARKAVVVICEVHPLQMRNCDSSLEAFTRFLDEVGYASEPLDPPGPGGIFHARIARREAR